MSRSSPHVVDHFGQPRKRERGQRPRVVVYKMTRARNAEAQKFAPGGSSNDDDYPIDERRALPAWLNNSPKHRTINESAASPIAGIKFGHMKFTLLISALHPASDIHPRLFGDREIDAVDTLRLNWSTIE